MYKSKIYHFFDRLVNEYVKYKLNQFSKFKLLHKNQGF
jgi:hypothetical protein